MKIKRCLKFLSVLTAAILLCTSFAACNSGNISEGEKNSNVSSADSNDKTDISSTVSTIEKNKYINERYGFSITLPDYWVGKTNIVETDSLEKANDSTSAKEYIIFYNKYLYDKDDLSAAFLMRFEVYAAADFDLKTAGDDPNIKLIGKNDDYVVAAVMRSGVGIIGDKEGAEQWKLMDSSIDDVLLSFTFL